MYLEPSLTVSIDRDIISHHTTPFCATKLPLIVYCLTSKRRQQSDWKSQWTRECPQGDKRRSLSDQRVCRLGRCRDNGAREQMQGDSKTVPVADREMWRFATRKVIKSQLQDINVNASERTVRRKLKDLNFKTGRPTRKCKLTPATKAKRLNWAKQWRDKDAFFWRSNKTQFVRRRDGEKFHSDCVVRTVKHPTKIMIWSVISGKGTGRLDVVKARSIKAFLAEENIPLLDWPGNSPDMNPIENIWELMKREVAKVVITNKTQLLERIIHVWNNHPQMQDTVQSCIGSMPRIIEAFISAKGGSTKY
ncbi:transposable element Tcb2 transposase [Trichonephila clavipes]|uniref:Transposable element Tcb2 transposase n=1 Tax=Trichonephila clavipes TaxID=2585209 RepID=A0A8X7BAB0_TRICX|nr:transposable element Tcb2 transposase [Trichonephila clavipes]